jgi:putative hydrolase of the HAD superfamily
VLDVWKRESTKLEVLEPLRLFDDVGSLWTLSLRRFLVTTGFRRFQESKVRALGIENQFEAVLVDAVDEPARKGKDGLFRQILEHCELDSSQVVVLGDSPESEIAVGNRLGMVTVQMLREDVAPTKHARFRIQSCAELPNILRLLH